MSLFPSDDPEGPDLTVISSLVEALDLLPPPNLKRSRPADHITLCPSLKRQRVDIVDTTTPSPPTSTGSLRRTISYADLTPLLRGFDIYPTCRMEARSRHDRARAREARIRRGPPSIKEARKALGK